MVRPNIKKLLSSYYEVPSEPSEEFADSFVLTDYLDAMVDLQEVVSNLSLEVEGLQAKADEFKVGSLTCLCQFSDCLKEVSKLPTPKLGENWGWTLQGFPEAPRISQHSAELGAFIGRLQEFPGRFDQCLVSHQFEAALNLINSLKKFEAFLKDRHSFESLASGWPDTAKAQNRLDQALQQELYQLDIHTIEVALKLLMSLRGESELSESLLLQVVHSQQKGIAGTRLSQIEAYVHQVEHQILGSPGILGYFQAKLVESKAQFVRQTAWALFDQALEEGLVPMLALKIPEFFVETWHKSPLFATRCVRPPYGQLMDRDRVSEFMTPEKLGREAPNLWETAALHGGPPLEDPPQKEHLLTPMLLLAPFAQDLDDLNAEECLFMTLGIFLKYCLAFVEAAELEERAGFLQSDLSPIACQLSRHFLPLLTQNLGAPEQAALNDYWAAIEVCLAQLIGKTPPKTL